MSRNRAFLSTIFSVLFVLGTVHAAAQSFYGSIVGTVNDPSSAIVPGAKVTLTNTGTGEHRSTQTNSTGGYQFVNLIPSTYKVDVEMPGFQASDSRSDRGARG